MSKVKIDQPSTAQFSDPSPPTTLPKTCNIQYTKSLVYMAESMCVVFKCSGHEVSLQVYFHVHTTTSAQSSRDLATRHC